MIAEARVQARYGSDRGFARNVRAPSRASRVPATPVISTVPSPTTVPSMALATVSSVTFIRGSLPGTSAPTPAKEHEAGGASHCCWPRLPGGTFGLAPVLGLAPVPGFVPDPWV